jgi:hypothetical protein
VAGSENINKKNTTPPGRASICWRIDHFLKAVRLVAAKGFTDRFLAWMPAN